MLAVQLGARLQIWLVIGVCLAEHDRPLGILRDRGMRELDVDDPGSSRRQPIERGQDSLFDLNVELG